MMRSKSIGEKFKARLTQMGILKRMAHHEAGSSFYPCGSCAATENYSQSVYGFVRAEHHEPVPTNAETYMGVNQHVMPRYP